MRQYSAPLVDLPLLSGLSMLCALSMVALYSAGAAKGPMHRPKNAPRRANPHYFRAPVDAAVAPFTARHP